MTQFTYVHKHAHTYAHMHAQVCSKCVEAKYQADGAVARSIFDAAEVEVALLKLDSWA